MKKVRLMFRVMRNGIRIIIKILKLKRRKPNSKSIKNKAKWASLYLPPIVDRDVTFLIGETVLRAICVRIATILTQIPLK